MGLYELPYPNAYQEKNDRYTFIDPVDGQQYEYVAGQDGIDEEWIRTIKEFDRAYNAQECRFARWRKGRRENKTEYERTLLRLEDIGMDERKSSDALIDTSTDTEHIVIGDYEMGLFMEAYQEALDRLSDSLRTTWILYAEKGLTPDEISQYLGLPYETVKKRLQRIKKTLQREIVKTCPLMVSFLTRE